MTRYGFTLTVLLLISISIYLFVQAPVPLPDEHAIRGKTIPIGTVFKIVASENNIVRSLWTQEIVGFGKKSGLKFDEDWRQKNVHAGPLPALFLRETATSLEKNIVRLSLFLGSDYPINPSNLFTGKQEQTFKIIKQEHTPQFFFAEDTRLYTAMFPDYSSVQPCVDCHNDHPDSPKTDWILNDVMGATTWSYPKDKVTLDELFEIIRALRKSFRDAYTAYIDKALTFPTPPEIDDKWPRDGYYLPAVNVFMNQFSKLASQSTIELLIKESNKTTKKVGKIFKPESS